MSKLTALSDHPWMREGFLIHKVVSALTPLVGWQEGIQPVKN